MFLSRLLNYNVLLYLDFSGLENCLPILEDKAFIPSYPPDSTQSLTFFCWSAAALAIVSVDINITMSPKVSSEYIPFLE